MKNVLNKFIVLLTMFIFLLFFDVIKQAWELRIIPSFNILNLLAFKVAPVEVISVIISDDPVNGYISVAPRLLTNLNCVTPLENINSVVNFGYFVAIRNLFLFYL